MAETKPTPTGTAGQDPLNPEQRRAVDCDRNAVVAAGAGSGKTLVLASRYVRLIRSGEFRVDQILTLTFTRKAAAEMYRRIHGALRAESRAPGVPAESVQAAEAALADFFRARIQTLDSYGAYIVKQGASRYGIRPDFRIDNDGARELANQESLPFLISRRRHPALERLYRGKRPADIARELFAASAFLYGHIDEPAAYTQGTAAQFTIIQSEWEKTIEKLLPLVDELCGLVRENQEDDFLTQLGPAAEQYTQNRRNLIGGEEMGAYFADLLASHNSSGDPAGAAEAHPLRERFVLWIRIIGELAFANAAKGKRNSRAKEIAWDLRGMFRVYSSILVYALQGGIILSTMALLEEFQRSYVEKKRAQGILTFTDVARLARTILRDQKDLRNNEKDSFKAIMIDEFQDNNSLQKELLFLLAEKQHSCADSVPSAGDLEGEKLFFVGDEKQSIYRFRGADVSVFRELRTELGAENLSLALNYRSSPQLIACFNAFFGGSLYDPSGASPLFQYAAVFPPPALPTYEADYGPLTAGTDEEGEAHIFILDSKGGDTEEEGEENAAPPEGGGDRFGNAEHEAAFIAARIRTLLDEKDGAGQPRCSPGDIAILLRTRRFQGLFEKHLRILDIPYAAEGLSSFFADGPVNDMAAFLRLIAYPLDTEAYAISLRSPFVGLSLRGLALCVNAFNESESRTPFSGPPPLDEDDRRAYEKGGELYRRVRNMAGGLSISQLLNWLWYEEGYRYETIWNSRAGAYREFFDHLYAQAVKADDEGLSLAAFSDRLEALREREEPLDDTEIPLERPGAVRLLTIHKSKGLEFKIVFIVCCGNRGRGGKNDKDIYFSASGHGLSFNPPLPSECVGLEEVRRNFFYEEDRLEERRKETAELRRLLYVAITRARRRLYLSGSFSLKARDGEILPALGAALEKKKQSRFKKDKGQGFRALEGDKILDDGTFFGLLLPALCETRPWIGEDGKPVEAPAGAGLPPYLSLELIPPLEPAAPKNREGRGYPNNRSGLARFLRDAGPRYTAARVLQTPVTVWDRLNASAARDLLLPAGAARPDGEAPEGGKTGGPVTGSWRHDPDLSGQDAAGIFARVDLILSRNPAELGFSEFGTLAHLCVEALLSNEEARIPPQAAGKLKPADAEVLLEAGKNIAERFLASPLGREARQSPYRRSEYAFRSLWDNLNVPAEAGSAVDRQPHGEGGTFVNGVIDLLFEWEREVRVVDFKTDSVENPGEHLIQMAFYERAVRELRGKPCRVWLYYLRTGRAIEMGDLTWNAAQP
jgi:ATP-dependent helicase/nuclease subunit A